MVWLIYHEYFKSKEKDIHLFRELKWYKWIILISMLSSVILSYVLLLNTNSILLIIACLILSLLSGLYIGYELKKIKEIKYGTERDIHSMKLKRLKQILSSFDVTQMEQLDMLTKQIEEMIPSLKISEKVYKKVKDIIVLIIIPISLLFIKEFLSKDEYIVIALIIYSFIFIVIGIWCISKDFFETILDLQHNNMKELKISLEDVKIALLKD